MVVQTKNKSNQAKAKHSLKSAHLYDRMAAFVADFSLVLFVHFFISFALRAKQKQAFMEGFQYSFFFWMLLSFILFLTLYCAYNYFSLRYFGKTIGKAIFHIHLQDIWTNQRPTSKQALSYAVWKTLSVVLFGLPFLSVLTDKKRRVVHEKMSDLANYTYRNRYQLPPTDKEIQLIKGFVLPFQLVIMFFSIFSLYKVSDYLNEFETLAVLEMPLSPKCDFIDDMLVENHKPRLEVAISMYLLEKINSECLEVEGQAAFEKGKHLGFANMAYSLVYPAKRTSFLEQACGFASFSDYCSDNVTADSSDLTLLLAAKRNFNQTKYPAALANLSAIKDDLIVRNLDFLKIKTLLQTSAKKSLLFSLETLKHSFQPEVYGNSVAWLCQQDVANDCQTSSPACAELDVISDFSEYSRRVQIAYVDLQVCNGEKSLLPLGMDESIQDYYYARWLQKEKQDTKELEALLSSYYTPAEIQLAAVRNLSKNKDIGLFFAERSKENEETTDIRKPASSEAD